MLQRFGAVFGVAVASAVFSAYGGLGSPAAFTDGFRPAVMVAGALALLGALAGCAVATRAPGEPAAATETPIPASSVTTARATRQRVMS